MVMAPALCLTMICFLYFYLPAREAQKHLPGFLNETGVGEREFFYKTVLHPLNSEGKFIFCVLIL